jgi:hypothetical protein
MYSSFLIILMPRVPSAGKPTSFCYQVQFLLKNRPKRILYNDSSIVIPVEIVIMINQVPKKEKPPAIGMTEGLTEVVRTGIEPVFHP